MQLPDALNVPQLDPRALAQVRRLCDAIVESAKLGLDPGLLVESLNDCTANEFSAQDVVDAAARMGTQTLACLAMSPPTPRVDAELPAWTEVITRIRAGVATGFERAWWLELIDNASGHDDAVAQVLAPDAGDPHSIATRLFAR
ncbi:MAG: hypothetical protein IPH07_25485 [Deltaproteobacteria bacterium]|nr:hypothetical protein [Deltaproteobacteria bacterium]MBK8240615.1 hypothetical protein [Deltaproteobacteria bacterium]MBK8718110.1 hypothetical protein [Deltaproteobacteria bacterium]MBP7288480.1 hypothetical protein [Nannocystaceae bacterium]